MRKLPSAAAEELLEIVMRRYERAGTLVTSNRPVVDWGKLLGDNATVTACNARPPPPSLTFRIAAKIESKPRRRLEKFNVDHR